MKTILWGDMYDKKISAAAIAVIMSASMMFTTASADASYVLDKDAGEDFVNFIDGKLPDILKSMDSVADGDKTYFDYGSWFMDLDYDGVPEFIIGGEMADGDRHYSILTKDGKEIKIDDTVANGQYFPGFMGFDYMPYRDLYTGEVSYFSSNDKIKTMTFDPEKALLKRSFARKNTIWKLTALFTKQTAKRSARASIITISPPSADLSLLKWKIQS